MMEGKNEYFQIKRNERGIYPMNSLIPSSYIRGLLTSWEYRGARLSSVDFLVDFLLGSPSVPNGFLRFRRFSPIHKNQYF